jgi:hypothetical protein
MDEITYDTTSQRETVADRPTPVPELPPLPPASLHVTRRVVAWTLAVGTLRVVLRRSERREWAGRDRAA